jgi:DNA-binding CsgD family transcriptional regulator
MASRPSWRAFVGRPDAMREVAGLLEEHRLVTVTGPGGVGKTRLAVQVARAVAGRFADGAWLAELATAAKYALMLTDPGPPQPAAPGPGTLSARERELVRLVAQGRTDAQIAAQLYISIRTVRSHLDRIRDKTGCRRRADLTRLALSAGLV